MALKELEVRYATKRSKDYKLADGGGLYVLVRSNGSKLWRFKYRYSGKEKLLAFGRYPDVGLANARLRREEAKIALQEGVDPGARAPRRAVRTFEEVARAWHTNRCETLDPTHASRLLARLERDAFPPSGKPICAPSPALTCWRWCDRLKLAERSTSAGGSSSM